jgi:hypothetical protein
MGVNEQGRGEMEGRRERGTLPGLFLFLLSDDAALAWCWVVCWEDLSFCIGDKRSKTSKQGVRYWKAVRND